MANSQITRQDDGTIKLTITLPQAKIVIATEEAIVSHSKDANVPGFRKGKAPESIVKGNLDPAHIKEDVLKKLLPVFYSEAISEHGVRPIMNPKMHIGELPDDKDWIVEALTCEIPDIKLGDYRGQVKSINAKNKIILPKNEVFSQKGESENKKPALEEIIKAALEGSEVKIPQILVDQEADRLLAQLLDDIKKLGLNLEQYLASTKRTPDTLRKEYQSRAENDIKFEFVLQKISELEKITVSDKEIEEAIQKAKSDNERQNLEANRYLLASILRQQKTLDFLMGL